jgi:hypothetical protein
MMRTASGLVTVTALLSTLFLGHTRTVWEVPLPPYGGTVPTAGQAAYIRHHIAVSKTMFLGAGLAWLLLLGGLFRRQMRKPTIKSAFVAIATFTGLLSAVAIVYGSVVAVASSPSYASTMVGDFPAKARIPLPLTFEQASYGRYHMAVVETVAGVVLLAWLLMGLAGRTVFPVGLVTAARPRR